MLVPRWSGIVHNADLIINPTLFRIPNDHRTALTDLEFFAVFNRGVIQRGNRHEWNQNDALIRQLDVYLFVVKLYRADAGFFREGVLINGMLNLVSFDSHLLIVNPMALRLPTGYAV